MTATAGRPAPPPGDRTIRASDPGQAAAATSRVRSSLVGSMVGEYRVTGIVGKGGMGTVYSGIHPAIEKRVAIKVLKSSMSDDPEAMQRFLAEARAVNRIGHPNIVDIFAFGEFEDGSQYLVMELLPGCTLGERLKRLPPLSHREVQPILEQVLDALEAAHERQIIHRDLKPDNIFLVEHPGGETTVKLLDFGIAKFGDQALPVSQTRTGRPMGTPLYMSPEQCRGRGVDHQSDIYSLGVILYQMFTGTVPFVGESNIDVANQHLSQPPSPPHDLCQIPAELERLILHCLAKTKEERPADVAAVRRELLPVLRRLAEGGGTLSPSACPEWAPAGPRAGDATPVVTPRSLAATVALGRRPLALAGFAVVLVALGFGVYRLARGGPTPPAPAPLAAPHGVAARKVTIQFIVEPANAPYTIWVDGRALTRPELETTASRERRLDVKVTATGYRTFTAQPLPLSDLVFPVTLVKLEPGPPVAPARGEPRHLRRPRPPASPSRAAAPAPPVPRVPRIDKL